MAETGYRLDSLRPNRFEGGRVMLALAISLFAHVLLFSGYELSRQIPLLHRLLWMAAQQRPVAQIRQNEEPLEFVTVPNPSAEAPQHPKYLSNHNSIASDDSANHVSETPQLNGHQSDVPQTHDEYLHRNSPSQTGESLRNENNSQAAPQDVTQPKPAQEQGDLTLGKPDQAQQERPRTLKEAYEQMANRVPSLTMQENGGVGHHARVPSFDVKITGFGDYDERFVEAVSENWWNLLDSQKFSLDRTGKVVLLFRLNYDGTISQMRFAENNVGDLLGYVCEKAVLDGAPYEKWSEDMRLKLGDYTDVQFTFDYYAQ
jgi:hypothetical protein